MIIIQLIVGNFNTPPIAMNRSSKQKINKETIGLSDTLEQMDLTDIFRTFYPKAAEYTFFSSAHETFSRIDHILGHKSALRYKKTDHSMHIFRSQHLKSTTRKNLERS